MTQVQTKHIGLTRKTKSKWCKGGIRQDATVKIPWQYWRKGRRDKWRLEEENLTETEFCHMFARERPGFFRGARCRINYASMAELRRIRFNAAHK